MADSHSESTTTTYLVGYSWEPMVRGLCWTDSSFGTLQEARAYRDQCLVVRPEGLAAYEERGHPYYVWITMRVVKVSRDAFQEGMLSRVVEHTVTEVSLVDRERMSTSPGQSSRQLSGSVVDDEIGSVTD